MQEHDWITLHRVKFGRPLDGTASPLQGPDSAQLWRFYPDAPFVEGKPVTDVSDEWGGFGLFASRADAEAVVADPATHLHFPASVNEAWHALAIPVRHTGTVRWRDKVERNCALRVASPDPGGPLSVLTTAGYDSAETAQPGRVLDFLRGIEEVRDFYARHPGNLRRAIFSGVSVDGRDGPSLTLWRSDAAMLEAAYNSGVHREQMDAHRDRPKFDRSSFTRLRILASTGTWDGDDPVAQMDQ